MRKKDTNQFPLFGSEVRFGPERPSLAYVIQEHHATRLHFDFRLEIDGVMKSWAMPIGPSVDPRSTRLAVQVRDHSKAHNAFEGVIPPGGYGAGPVMLWDRGSYAPNETGAFDVEMLLDAYERGTLSCVLFGERLRGRWTLTRRRGQHGERSQWELQKQADSFASRQSEPVREFRTSVATGLTMKEIEEVCAAHRRRTVAAERRAYPHGR